MRSWLTLYRCLLLPLAGAIFTSRVLAADEAPRPTISVQANATGRLVYTADVAGNKVVDFSRVGYASGDNAIPFVPAQIAVEPRGDDDGDRIQAALDLVAAMPRNADGFRGAVLLKPGTFRIAGTLHLAASGVVLRGTGEGAKGTVLLATGTSRRTLIEVGGRGLPVEIKGSRKTVTDALVPVGATQMTLNDVSGLAVGHRVRVQRASTAEWIASLGMSLFPGWRSETRLHWLPGSRDLFWDRTISAIQDNRLTLDAPITTALDRALGSGAVYGYEFPGRIDHVGVENLRCVSEFDASRPQDEEHAWGAVALDNVEQAWVRRITAEHFAGYVFNAQANSLAVTIEDCTALDPISEKASYRRRVFAIGGQLTLVQHCQSERGLADFTTGFAAAGPNVFFQCRATDAQGYSGPTESWASGVLYDNVTIRGEALRLFNRGIAGQGSGWAAANSILWNCEATDIQVQSPPGASNQAYGCKGDVTDDSVTYDERTMPYREFDRGMPIQPASLYLAQLAERLSRVVTTARETAPFPVEVASARMLSSEDVKAYQSAVAQTKAARGSHPLRIEGAQFMIDGQPAWTAVTNYSWFQGQMPRAIARSYGPAITRFAPGETGLGLTDDLEDVAAGMAPRSAFYQHYGLWYERRRVNHNFYGAPEHRDADVWAPFMEQPWARSGIGRDWNGMSKYDLTRFNPWYFSRVKEFAEISEARGLILYHHFYFQHPLQETRAHYVDFPWRPANCLQETGLPDENPAASTFYDVSHPVRRDLHRRYIRHTLDVLGQSSNVVFGIDREYSGPLTFVQFWLDTVAEWEVEHHRKVLICLEVPKAEMDALLADPVRGPMITAIDFHFWFYRPDGSLYTIEGGLNRAPREQSVGIVTDEQMATLRATVTNPLHLAGGIVNSPEFQQLTQKIRNGSAAMRYRAWREYRDRYPELVIVRKTDEFPALTAAVEKSIPTKIRAQTAPAPLVGAHVDTSWCMAAPGKDYVVYAVAGEAVELDLSKDAASFALTWVDERGAAGKDALTVEGGKVVTLKPPVSVAGRACVAWLTVRR